MRTKQLLSLILIASMSLLAFPSTAAAAELSLSNQYQEKLAFAEELSIPVKDIVSVEAIPIDNMKLQELKEAVVMRYDDSDEILDTSYKLEKITISENSELYDENLNGIYALSASTYTNKRSSNTKSPARNTKGYVYATIYWKDYPGASNEIYAIDGGYTGNIGTGIAYYWVTGYQRTRTSYAYNGIGFYKQVSLSRGLGFSLEVHHDTDGDRLNDTTVWVDTSIFD